VIEEGQMNTMATSTPDLIMVFLEEEPSMERYGFIKQLLADFQLDVDPISVTVRITDSYADSLDIARAAKMAATMRGRSLDASRSTMEEFLLYDVRGTLASIYMV
jgi:hypothetical protein